MAEETKDRLILDEELAIWLNTTQKKIDGMAKRRCFPTELTVDGNHVAHLRDVVMFLRESERVPSDFIDVAIPDPYRVTEWLVDENGVLHWVPADGPIDGQIRWSKLINGGPAFMETACMKNLVLDAPEIGDRYNAPRCNACCDEVGIPVGKGSWRNDPMARSSDFLEY